MRFVTDENFSGPLLRGLLRRIPDLDYVRAQDIPELYGKDDPTLLRWATEQQRVILTHDVQTFPGFAYARMVAGESTSPVIIIPRGHPMQKIIEDLLIIIGASDQSEWENQIIYLPF